MLAIVAPQVLGGATPETELAILFLSLAVSGAVALTFARSERTLGKLPLAGLAALIGATWTFIQALPMPCALVRWLDPERLAVQDQLLRLGATQAPTCTISWAPGSTWAAFGLATSLFAVLLASAAVARAGYDHILIRGVAVSALVMAVVAVGHTVLDAKTVFGIYRPVSAKPGWLLAPLLNGNHLAGLLALGLPACLAQMLKARGLDAKIAWAAGVITVVGTGFFTLSRAGSAALLGGGVGFLVLQAWSRRKVALNRAQLLSMSVALVCLALGASFGMDLVRREFAHTAPDLDKLKIPLEFAGLLRTHGLLGVGRGALSDASARVLPWNARVLFTENLPSQWWVEWGLVVGTLVLVGITVSLVRSWSSRRDELAMACGLIALAAQNLVDFSLELAGVATVAAVGFGALLRRERAASWLKLPNLRPLLAPAAGLAAVGLLFALPWLTWKSRGALQSDLNQAVQRRDGSLSYRLREAFAGYPLDPVFLVIASDQAAHPGNPDAFAWLNLSFAAAPGWSAPHLQAARLLETLGRLDQAAIELSYAAGQDIGGSLEPLCGFARRHPDPDLLWELAPPEHPNARGILEHVESCLASNPAFETTRTALLRRLLELAPESTRARRDLVLLLLRVGQAEEALSLALAGKSNGDQDAATILLVEAYLGAGKPLDAQTLLTDAPAPVRLSEAGLKLAARAAAALNDRVALGNALELLLARHSRNSAMRANQHLFAASLYASVGDSSKALSHAQSAQRIAPSVRALETVYRSARSAGLDQIALHTALELCQLRHQTETFCTVAGQAGR
ncbi:MAG: hypothetical protein QM778_08790 [Myxococcales bacterium]